MKNIEKLKEKIKSQKNYIHNKYEVQKIGLFGSYVRGEENKDSDIDILIELSKPIGLIEYIQLEDYLSDILNTKVDLVLKEGLKPALKDKILDEVEYL